MEGTNPAQAAAPPSAEEVGGFEEDFEAYLEAVERCDAADAAEPAAALAELLAARLEGRDHPEARRVLDGLAFPAGRAAPGQSPAPEDTENSP